MKKIALLAIITTFLTACSSMPKNNNPIAEIMTSKGTITVELFEDQTPNNVANFIVLAESGFYKNCSFHRVLKNFMAQGGCPNSRAGSKGIPGTGDPGYYIDNEFSADLKHKRGVLNMGHAGGNTVGSQFCIFFKDAPHLDGIHTVFGRVIKGMEVVDQIEAIASLRDPNPPLENVTFDVKIIRKRDHAYSVKKNSLKK